MKFIALVSGGKDSCYAMHLVSQDGNELVGLANLKPETSGETDSYMFQTVGQDVIDVYAEALDVPLFQRTISGKPINQEMEYNEDVKGDEVEDLYELLREIKDKIPYDAVSCGAIHSNYQRLRAENVCARLGVKLLSPLWGRDQTELLTEMIQSGIDAILIKVAALGLNHAHLGKSLDTVFDDLMKLKTNYGINVCGEGGEYESLTLNSPLFKKKIVM